MFDFSSPYRNIPHHKLKSMMGELINFCFNGGDKVLNGITKPDASWTNDQQKYNLSFNETPFKLAINCLLDNFY